jgi:sec-independent protein translocase protein TatA
MGGLSIWHWVVVLLVVLLLFGSGKISGLMGDVAKGIKSFRNNMKDDETDASMAASEPSTPSGSLSGPQAGAQQTTGQGAAQGTRPS